MHRRRMAVAPMELSRHSLSLVVIHDPNPVLGVEGRANVTIVDELRETFDQ